MDKRAIQKRRIMSYFIDAALEIIETEGVEAVTIRKVADRAGYNSATIYNYFQNLDHLVFFAYIKYINSYLYDLPNYVEGSKNTLDKYLRIWKCFCHYSFQNPKIYYATFFGEFSPSLESAFEEYYSIFPEQLEKRAEDLLPMLLKADIYHRNLTRLEMCAEEGLIRKEDIDEINEMTLLIYQGMLARIISKKIDPNIEEATKKMLKYIRKTIMAFKLSQKTKSTID